MATTKLNKSAWIRSQPLTMSAVDVVKKGKAEGIKLSVAFVYTARANAKKAQGTKAKAGAKANPTRAAWRNSVPTTDHEAALRRIVVHEVGLRRAQEILNELANIGL